MQTMQQDHYSLFDYKLKFKIMQLQKAESITV